MRPATLVSPDLPTPSHVTRLWPLPVLAGILSTAEYAVFAVQNTRIV